MMLFLFIWTILGISWTPIITLSLFEDDKFQALFLTFALGPLYWVVVGFYCIYYSAKKRSL